MEIILEHEDIEALLRKALRKEGVIISDSAQMKVRQNHKKGTIRVVFKERKSTSHKGDIMGHYTGLRFEAKLTAQAHMAISIAKEVYRSEGNEVPFWEIVRSQGVKIPDEFLAYGRASFIPHGRVCYMPDDWGEQKNEISHGGVWTVVCSAKDVGYHETPMMALFCEEVLPLLIREPCTAEIRVEGVCSTYSYIEPRSKENGTQ